ncbi:hypothetical protein ACFQ5J_06035 [Lacticaseibacillus baoqingensis]|uniref:Uncharacterized protein n=1 Tax=Lacticaseibacillus baoqingensis TaxID=2486013 RepID=A0ABW4E6J4_9LACO|nr:hypothetical protein [Lacticaseibacillus baoqingensis]
MKLELVKCEVVKIFPDEKHIHEAKVLLKKFVGLERPEKLIDSFEKEFNELDEVKQARVVAVLNEKNYPLFDENALVSFSGDDGASTKMQNYTYKWANNFKKAAMVLAVEKYAQPILAINQYTALLETLQKVEDTFQVAFFDFDPEQVVEAVNTVKNQGDGNVTVVSRILAYRNMIEKMSEFSDIKTTVKAIDVANVIADRKVVRKTPNRDDVLAAALNMVNAQDALPVVLAMSGVRITSSGNDDELSDLKTSNVSGRVIHIPGESERDISLDPIADQILVKAMQQTEYYTVVRTGPLKGVRMSALTESNYLVRPVVRSGKTKNVGPLKKTAMLGRIKKFTSEYVALTGDTKSNFKLKDYIRLGIVAMIDKREKDGDSDLHEIVRDVLITFGNSNPARPTIYRWINVYKESKQLS